jgi:hypothetical protein
MGSGVMIYIPNFIKIGSGIQKLIGWIHRHTDSILLLFKNKGSRLKICQYADCHPSEGVKPTSET